MMQTAHDFPLAALVGQEQLKSALLLCAVNPGIGGVLIRGEKGSAKSTAARGLAAVMAPIERVVDCTYNCALGEPAVSCEVCNGAVCSVETTPVPFVNLPLGASEDRVLGSLDFERALKDGRKAFQPGLLASSHRGILYIDEVNLLPDHLVDVLLDVAAMGINRVQREGLSVQHAARIALVGTMNQEEGELRPQLLDRFGMMVEVRAPQDPRLRTEIVKRRLAWEADPEGFNLAWSGQQAVLRQRVLRAQELLPKVAIAEGLLLLISELCCSQGVASLRADLVMNKAARALAALRGSTRVDPEDLSQAAVLVLPHRRRTKPFEQPGLDEQQLQRFMEKATSSAGADAAGTVEAGTAEAGAAEADAAEAGAAEAGAAEADAAGAGAAGAGADEVGTAAGSNAEVGNAEASNAEASNAEASNAEAGNAEAGNAEAGNAEAGKGGAMTSGARQPGDQIFSPVASAPPPRIELKSASVARGVVGRRSSAPQSHRGREVRAVLDERPTELAITATLHHTLLRTGGLSSDGRLDVTRADLHQKIKAGRHGSLILFVVDASGSMAALQRMEMVKGTVLALLRDAYQRRDEVGVIAFRGTEAKLLLPPTRSVDAAERQLRELPTGGRTPLAHALQLAGEVLARAVSPAEPLLIVLSDGRANVGLDGDKNKRDPWQQSLDCARMLEKKGVAALVIDTEVGFVRMGRARALAAMLGAHCLALDEFTTDSLMLTIRSRSLMQ
jgi:magnesium chelatase subunit D